MTDPLGNSAQFNYDAAGRVVSSIDPLHNQTAVSYDPNGNLLRVTDANGGTTTFAYDSRNRVQSRTDPLQASAHFTYDPNGNLSAITDRKGQTTQFAYDALNRVTQATYADGSTISLTYDAGNRVTQVADSVSGTITYSYDQFNRLISTSSSFGTVSYTYNAAGQRTSMTVAGQPTVSYMYDAAGRLTQISQGSATVVIAYDSAGRRSSLTLPNGVTASYSYDAASRLSAINYTNASGILGNLTYQYDAAGHRVAIGGTLASTALPNAMSGASYNAANQLVSWNGAGLTYDANGNLINDGTNAYSWDARNQLASITGPSLSASFLYDSSGRRITKQINGSHWNFLFDGLNVVQEQSVGYVTANLLTGFGVDETFVRTDATGSYSFLTGTANSTVALTDSNGNVSTEYAYDPFGNTTQSGASANTFQFTGRENDGTGLYYLRARYYSPSLQRFISQDPIGFAGGINLYGYAGNNPVSLSDPLGTDPGGGNNNDLDNLQRSISNLVRGWNSAFHIATLFAGFGLGAGPEGLASEIDLNFSDGVLQRMAEDPGPYHNFPTSIGQAALEGEGQIINNNYILYTLDGSINGVDGTYEVGVNSFGQITHYFFNPK